MSEPRKQYWFPAKRVGWGWGLPNTWQGWCVLAVYVAFISWPLLLGEAGIPLLYVMLGIGTVGMLWVVVKKGEPPEWRWPSRRQ